jgi:MEMO1 family protein
MATRRPDFAGSWYPSSERDCRRTFEQYEETCVARSAITAPRGGIVPHAGWFFSGRLAYNTIRELVRDATPADTVVLFGGHLLPSSSATVMVGGDFWTPLGEIPTDEELAEALASRVNVRREPADQHTPDNTTELQAPIIRHLLPEARLVVIAAPPRSETLVLASSVVEVARELGRRIVAIGSTDLTHYGPNYGWAPRGRGEQAVAWVRDENDRRWIDLACKLAAQGVIDEALESSNACCSGAAAAAIECGRHLGATSGELLAYATSADIRPDDSFVGYASILF